MATTDPARNRIADLEGEVARRYRWRVRGLRLTVRDEELTLDGVAESFHALQLVLRDVLAAGAAPVVRSHIIVRSAPAN